MRTTFGTILAAPFVALLTLSAAAQTPETADRVFRFQNTNKAQDFMELSTLIRVVSGVPRVTTDESEKTLELRGPSEEIALAEWLFHELDQPADPKSRAAAVHQYTLSSGNENVVRLFYLPNATTVLMFQEIATLVRTVGDIRRLFTYNAARALVARGTAEQIELAAWLVDAIDKGSPAEYQMAANSDPRGDTVVHLFRIAHAASDRDFQELAIVVRTIGDIRRVFTYNEPRIMVVRSTAEQNALTQWLVQQLEQPAAGQAAMYEYQAPRISDNIIKLYYLRNSTAEQFQHDTDEVRQKTGARMVLGYSRTRALAVRGNVNQVQMAERLVAELEPAGK